MKVFLLPKISTDVSINTINSTDLNSNPLISTGYNYYITQTKDKYIQLVLSSENVNKRFFYIIENLTRDIPNYDKNIDVVTNKYFNEKVSDNFLQIWEILLNFQLVTSKVSTNSEVAESVFEHMKKYTNITIGKNTKYTHMFLINDIILTTSETEISKKITKFISNINKLEKNGSLIIKIKDFITMPSLQLLYMLSYLFENVYMYQPDFSYISHGEKYIVCTNFTGKQLKYNTDNSFLLLDTTIPSEYIFTLNIINRILMQEEYIMLNIMRTYIESQNYNGEEYHKYLGKQKVNSDKWIANHLMVSSKDYDELKKIKEKELSTALENYRNMIEERSKMYL